MASSSRKLSKKVFLLYKMTELLIIKVDVKKCDRMEDREQRTEQPSLMLSYMLLWYAEICMFSYYRDH